MTLCNPRCYRINYLFKFTISFWCLGSEGTVQRASYTPSLEDDGGELVCTATQGSLYSSQIETRMGVNSAQDIGPAIPIGGIIGIILGVLFLLFLCAALLLLFICRDKLKSKRKKDKDWTEKTSVASDIHEVQQPAYISGSITHQVASNLTIHTDHLDIS